MAGIILALAIACGIAATAQPKPGVKELKRSAPAIRVMKVMNHSSRSVTSINVSEAGKNRWQDVMLDYDTIWPDHWAGFALYPQASCSFDIAADFDAAPRQIERAVDTCSVDHIDYYDVT